MATVSSYVANKIEAPTTAYVGGRIDLFLIDKKELPGGIAWELFCYSNRTGLHKFEDLCLSAFWEAEVMSAFTKEEIREILLSLLRK